MIIRTIHDLRYVAELPKRDVSQVTFKSGVELLQLKSGRRTFTTGNIEPRQGLPLLLYSQQNDWYWYRVVYKDHDMAHYRPYIPHGMLYIHWTDHWKDVIRAEQEKESGMKYVHFMKLRELRLIEDYLKKEFTKEYFHTHMRAVQVQRTEILKLYD